MKISDIIYLTSLSSPFIVKRFPKISYLVRYIYSKEIITMDAFATFVAFLSGRFDSHLISGFLEKTTRMLCT